MINMIYPEISKGFLNQLENIINKYGIDSLTGIEDFFINSHNIEIFGFTYLVKI